ncbi:MAG: pyridoxamine 5'-phosphate oxidase family protein [Rhodobiaceae bacterium]|nr:pyridoxamine 5'-phosphate oxidase family protein [Rhodobiaceae bacterium]
MTEGWPHEGSPFHKGEQEIQDRVGVRDRAEMLARRVVRDHMPDQHREFYEALPFLLLGSTDQAGRPWASVVAGPEGFISSPDPRRLKIQAAPLPGDPLAETLASGTPIGVLGIDPATRRRNRMTGKIGKVERQGSEIGGFEIDVAQAFGNCPKFIQTRSVHFSEEKDSADKTANVEKGTVLDAQAQNLIATADTFFIATTFKDENPSQADGSDVSHRGGKPGFVKVETDRSLLFPDFVGNNHFNTLGNIQLNSKAGLLFIDFASGDLLYLTGDAEIIWEGPELASFEGAHRLVRFNLDEMVRSRRALPLQVSFGEYSPYLAKTGAWN